MGKMPYLPYGSQIKKLQQVQFAGYQHTDGAQDGAIWDMDNMTGDNYPVLQPRKKRLTTNTDAWSIYGHEELVRHHSYNLYYGDVSVGTLTTSAEKIMAAMGDRILIWPDKMILNVKDTNNITLESIEKTTYANRPIFKDGTYKGIEAKANTVKATGVQWDTYFKVGDAVEISGCTVHTENNKTPVIREIVGDELHFYEEVFFLGDDQTSYQESGYVTFTKKAPDLDGLFTCENRAWGYKDDTIYCSKLGDPSNWYVYEGISTDSWFVESGTPGNFTACCEYLGYPTFFKEDQIFKVYGAKPSNFQMQASATTGIPAGNEKTLAVASEILFWLGRHGVVSYTGGVPQPVSQNFGTVKLSEAAAGSDGRKYYLAAYTSENEYATFVYDPEIGQWFKESDPGFTAFTRVGGTLYAIKGNKLCVVNPEEPNETQMNSMIQFADFVEGDLNRKSISRLQLRLEIGQSATVTVQIQYDNETVWKTVKQLTATKKMSFWMPVHPRRCDRYRIRITSTGDWKLWAMAREVRTGSEKNYGPGEMLDF